MKTPIALVCGPAGSGKDSLAACLALYTDGICIAQADPMKRFAAEVFGFTEEQLWGPSSCRNAADTRYDSLAAWQAAGEKLRVEALRWVQDVLPELGCGSSLQYNAAVAIQQWFLETAAAHGFFRVPFDGLSVSNFGMLPQVGLQSRHTGVNRALTPRWVLQTLGTEWGRKFSPSMWVDYALRTARALLAGGVQYDRARGLQASEKAAPPKGYVFVTDGRFANEVVAVKAVGGSTILVQAPQEETLQAGVQGHRSETELKAIPGHFFDFEFENDKSHGLEALQEAAKDFAEDFLLRGTQVYKTAWTNAATLPPA